MASGFLDLPGIRVVILYPGGKVSHLQEQQLTTMGHNITALEIDGTFDDCHHIVKQAFLDCPLNQKLALTSANSINIARLIPQSFYYFYAWSLVVDQNRPVVFSVPSGNFGNLCGGLIAKRMGLPIHHFIAATNANCVFGNYLTSGTFKPRPSLPTISNAMDVGNPSNFARLLDLYDHDLELIRADVSSYAFSDEETKMAIRDVNEQTGYVLDPHGAVGYLAWQKYRMGSGDDAIGIILETAHPAKFGDVVSPIIGQNVPIPQRLAVVLGKQKQAVRLSKNYGDVKGFLLDG